MRGVQTLEFALCYRGHPEVQPTCIDVAPTPITPIRLPRRSTEWSHLAVCIATFPSVDGWYPPGGCNAATPPPNVRVPGMFGIFGMFS